MKLLVLVLSLVALSACADPQAQKPKGPVSDKSQLSWGRPLPGEGGAAFGGVLDQR